MRRVFLLIALCGASACAFAQGRVPGAGRSGTRPCSLLDSSRPASSFTADDLFRAYDTQVHLVHSLHLLGSMRGQAGAAYDPIGVDRSLAAIIEIAQPDLIRITGVMPYQGNRVIELTSDGHQFGLLTPESGRTIFLTGPIDAPPQSKNPYENLRPRPFVEALLWQAGTPQASSRPEAAEENGMRTLTIAVAAQNSPTRTMDIAFNMAKGVVNSFTAYDKTGKPIFEAQYSDWRPVSILGSDVPGGCLARHIVLEERQRDYRLDLRISSLELNADIPRSSFHPSPPRGIPVKRLTLTGDENGH